MAFPFSIEEALEVARRAAHAAGVAALRHWRRLEAVETKADGSPVTVADREAEAAAEAVIVGKFPRHGILGEEGGTRGGVSPESKTTRWILDPIDGTRGFSRGGVHWGPLVALEHEGEIVAGALGLPALGVGYAAARGLGCFRDGTRIRLSQVSDWREATVSLGGMRRLLFDGPKAPGILGLVRTASSARAYGDLAACAMLLDGVADAWFESGVNLWDLAPGKILVEEAGGRFTDFEGRPSVESGDAVATNGILHEHVLRALRENREGPASSETLSGGRTQEPG